MEQLVPTMDSSLLEKTNFRPARGHLLVKNIRQDNSVGGIVLPVNTSLEPTHRGVIIKTPLNTNTDEDTYSEGTEICYTYPGVKINIQNKEFEIVAIDTILGVLL